MGDMNLGGGMSRSRARRAVLAASAALVLVALAGCTGPSGGSDDGGDDASAEATSACDAGINAEKAAARHINLVIDDSGSMFSDDDEEAQLDRWSQAKYALEVFAAMLGDDDTLNVYRLSDFADGRESGPEVTLTGDEPTSSRVEKIHSMQLQGGRTPYAPVQRAYSDLTEAVSDDKWLVVLSDGEFNGRSAAEVEADLRTWADQGTTEDSRLSVAFLAIGDSAPEIANDPDNGIHFEHAAESSDLLDKMTGFSNLIFERNLVDDATGGVISPDIDLSEVLVFAQGQNVEVGDATGDGVIPAESTVEVSWTQNQVPMGKTVQPMPDEDLRGVLAKFTDVPKGSVAFDVSGAEEVAYFYKPKVNFGIELQNADGVPVDASKIIGGEYTLRYGFMDEDCSFVESPLLGDVEYSAQAFSGGELIAESFQSGDSLDFSRGDVELDVTARYLGGNTSQATIDLTVLQAARPTAFEVAAPIYQASELALPDPPPGPIAVTYGLEQAGSIIPFSPEEWASVTPESISVTSPANLDFDVALGDAPGEVFVTPRAPDGDVYAADTGEIDLQLAASHTYDEQLYEAQSDATVTVQDDIPWFERFMHWFVTIGWLLLLALILLIIVIGYIVKPRFSKKIKRNPTITGVPMRIGLRTENGNGRFRAQTGRKLLPYIADQATLVYVPQGPSGFRAMKLKARRGGKMTILNWKLIADKKNVALNGNDLNEDTKRPPVLGPSTNITATVPGQMRYELYLNN